MDGGVELAKSRKKKKKNEKLKFILLFFALFIIVVVFLISEIIGFNKNTKFSLKKNRGNSEENRTSENVVADGNEPEGFKDFDNFITDTFSEQELENMSAADMLNVYKNSEKIKWYVNNCKKIAGSAGSKEGAIINAKVEYANKNQFINSCKVLGESEYYYVVKVNYSYIDTNTNMDLENDVLVFKDSVYSASKNKFNTDKIEDVKAIYDLEYYVKNYSNGGRNLIQSFANSSNDEWIYTIYYFNAYYGQDNVDDNIDLVKDIIHINNKTGEVLNKESVIIRKGVKI